MVHQIGITCTVGAPTCVIDKENVHFLLVVGQSSLEFWVGLLFGRALWFIRSWNKDEGGMGLCCVIFKGTVEC